MESDIAGLKTFICNPLAIGMDTYRAWRQNAKNILADFMFFEFIYVLYVSYHILLYNYTKYVCVWYMLNNIYIYTRTPWSLPASNQPFTWAQEFFFQGHEPITTAMRDVEHKVYYATTYKKHGVA